MAVPTLSPLSRARSFRNAAAAADDLEESSLCFGLVRWAQSSGFGYLSLRSVNNHPAEIHLFKVTCLD